MAGYQESGLSAFYPHIYNKASINGVFFDGLSIMYGSPRKHIWTYTAGFNDGYNLFDNCPCNNGSTNQVPPYVGSDYYCESGTNSNTCLNKLFSNDVLWDGEKCGGIEAPCCTHPNMPWFIKTLNESTTEDIELRACKQEFGCDNSVSIFLIEIYVRWKDHL